MIVFPKFMTRRILAAMDEISMRNGLRVAGMPDSELEAAETVFLDAVLSIKRGPASTLEWTFQERLLAVSQYLMVVSESGADFALGDDGRLSDYLDSEHDYPADFDRVEIGEVGGDRWYVQHLTGAMVESIERTVDMVEGLKGRQHWLTAAMAAQLVREGEEPVDQLNPGAFDDYLIHRMEVLVQMPESAFTALLMGYYDAREKLHHLFRYDFAEEGGLLVLPLEKEGAASDLPPARFPVRSCLSEATNRLGGKPPRAGR